MAFKIVTANKESSSGLWCEPEPGVFISLLMRGTGCVEYRVGIPTKPQPNCGPLTAFKSLENVEQFKKENGWGRSPVFRCKVQKDKRGELPFTPHPLYGRVTLESPLPRGTVLCKSITLTKRIS